MTRKRAIALLLLLIALVAVVLTFNNRKPNGPHSTKTDSATLPTLAERTSFLHQYVTFRRTYETLDFDINYRNNNGGMVPAQSDWDIRIVATVPSKELDDWIPAGAKESATPDTDWMTSIPTQLDLTGVNEWYVDGGRIIGLDRAKRIVVYRLLAN
jgi:hypothetical protein